MLRAPICTNVSVSGIDFGAPESVLVEALVVQAGRPSQRRVSPSGEVEVHIDGAIYRFQRLCFVEATFPDHGANRYLAEIDGTPVLSVLEWLGSEAGSIDIARFRVNERLGIAYDYRNPETGSYTVFAPGHWAGLVPSGM